MFAIYKKELRSYFANAVGYVYLGVFLAISALLCCYTTLGMGTYDTSLYFTIIPFIFIIIIPLLTMKIFAEEKKLRTEQLLLTAPISITKMVLGKFLAAFTLFFGGLLLSLLNFIPLCVYANIDGLNKAFSGSVVGPIPAMIFSNALGLMLLGAAFIAIGMFISSLTENQLAAAIITVVVITTMLILDLVNGFINNYIIRFILSWVSFSTRFSMFQTGLFDPSALLYFVSTCGVFLFLTVRIYDKRRWN